MKRITTGIAVLAALSTVAYGPAALAASDSSPPPVIVDRAELEGLRGSLRGTTFIVDWDGSGDYATIQEALDASTNGDTIIVMPSAGSPPGAYVENIDFPAKAVTLRGSDPDDPAVVAATIIDGNTNGSVVTFQTGGTTDAILAGFTIRNGSASLGGGIHCDSSSPTIERCTISGNRAEVVGGGIYCESSSLTIDRCTISGNFAHYGGGMYNDMQSDSTLTNCVFSGNEAESFG